LPRSGTGKDRREDATREAESSEGCPDDGANGLAEGGGTGMGLQGRVKEIKGPKKADSGVKERNNVGPTDVIGGLRSGNRVEKKTVAVVKNTIRRSSDTVPKQPPPTSRVGERDVIRMLTKKMAIIFTMDGVLDRSGSGSGSRRFEVYLDKIPAGVQSTGRSVRDEE
jgi:hypothetical protein